MKLRSEKDFWSGLGCLALGAGFGVGALGLGFGSRMAPGPAFFPFAAGVFTVLVGAALLFKSLALETEGGDRIGRWPWLAMLLTAIAMVGFAWTLPRLGLFVAVPGLVLCSALAVGRVRLGTLVLQLLLLTGGAWMLYVWALRAAVPLWT